MEKISNNIKFCTFINILRTYSSKDVSISIKEINNHIYKKLGITLDRRTIYSYIKDMRYIGLNVSDYNKENEGYFLMDDFFTEYELRLLMDSVKASKFITKKKTEELLEKISKLNITYRGKTVKSNVFIDDTSKSTNEQIYDNLNTINEAIEKNNKITFNYSDKYHKSKQVCITDPINMINNHENYYLLTVNNLGEEISFNVDKMTNIQISQ